MKDYYYILGIDKKATHEEIKKAYRKLSLKFHPDKNDNDPFFEQRFGDIKEAYEALLEIHTDKQKSSEGEDLLVPVIIDFAVNKLMFSYDDEIRFIWHTDNADKVELLPIGTVSQNGEKAIKIKDYKNPKIFFKLKATNSKSGLTKEKSVSLRNETYFEMYSHFQDLFHKNSYKDERQKENKNKDDSKQSKTPPFKILQEKDISSFFKGKMTELTVELIDKKMQVLLFRTENNKEVYFKSKKLNDKYSCHYYRNLEKCVFAYDFFLETGKLSKEGYTGSYR